MISFPEILLRLALATVLGGLIGWERELNEHNAGLRTNALVSLGTALFTVISGFGFLSLTSYQHISLDPTRIASYVIAGIGFLGGGAIFMRRDAKDVRGLTTAATIWIVAAVGMACGVGMFAVAIAVTIATFGVLVGLRYVEAFVLKQSMQHHQELTIHISTLDGVEPEGDRGQEVVEMPANTVLEDISNALNRVNVYIDSITIHPVRENDKEYEDIVEIECHSKQQDALLSAVDKIRNLEHVESVHVKLRKGIII